MIIGIFLALFITEITLRVTGLPFEEGVGTYGLQVDARVGWVIRPNFINKECALDILEYCVQMRTNNQSLREDFDTSFEKLPGERRILVLGDSQTAGALVENKDAYANVLEDLLNEDNENNDFEVLNGGVSGYSPVQEWLWFRQRGVRYKPDITIIGFYVGNDLYEMRPSDNRPYFELLSDNGVILRNYPVQKKSPETLQHNSPEEKGALEKLKRVLRPFYVYQTVRYVAKQSAFADPLRKIGIIRSGVQASGSNLVDKEAQAMSVCAGCMMQSLSQSYHLNPSKEEVWFILLEKTFEHLKADVSSANSELILVLIPTKLQVEPGLEPDLLETANTLDLTVEEAIVNDHRIYRKVIDLGQKLGIEVIDSLPVFLEYHQKSSDEPLFFRDDWHLTPTGHRVLANRIYQYLITVQSQLIES